MTHTWMKPVLVASLLGLNGCTTINYSEDNWTRCTLGGTAALGGLTIASGMAPVPSAAVSIANAGLGCFLVFENVVARSEKKAIEQAEAAKVKAPPVNPSAPAMPIIPVLPTISEDDE